MAIGGLLARDCQATWDTARWRRMLSIVIPAFAKASAGKPPHVVYCYSSI